MNKLNILSLLIFILSACNRSSVPTSQLPDSRSMNNECIPPIVDFAYPVNQRHSKNTTQLLPLSPWQMDEPLPAVPSGARAFDTVSFARTKDGHNEVWVKRQLYFESENIKRSPGVQFLIYRPDTKEWKLIPDKLDENNAKSGLIYLANDGTIWANLSFVGLNYFAVYNEKKEGFEYVEESKTMPTGNLLLDDDEKFWIFENKGGIYSFDTVSRKIEQHVSMPDLETNSSLYGSMISLAPDGSIYFLTITNEQQSKLAHFFPKTNKLEFVPNFDHYLGDTSYNLFVDRSGRLWLGDLGWMETNGTWYRAVRSPVFITDRAESSENYIWSNPSIILESSNGLLWFQSDNGLTWLNPQKGEWCWFTTAQSNIVEDKQHNLWMIADEKLYKYSLKQ